MPIYEFICTACGRKSSFLTRSVNDTLTPVCGACGSQELRRAVSTFAHHRTTKEVHEAYGSTPEHPDLEFYKDPRNIGRNVEETFRKWNVEMPTQVRDTIDAAREGTMPQGIDL